MVIEILNGGEILVNWSKSRNSTFSVSHGTKSSWDFDWIWIPRYLAVQIQIEILIDFEFLCISQYKLLWFEFCSWLKSPHHSGFRLPFNSALRVSSSMERAVEYRALLVHERVLQCVVACCRVLQYQIFHCTTPVQLFVGSKKATYHSGVTWCTCVIWLNHMCAMTDSYAIVRMCDMTPQYVLQPVPWKMRLEMLN